MNTLKRFILGILGLILIIGSLFVSLNYDETDISSKSVTVTDSFGKKSQENFLLTDPHYKWSKPVSEFLLTIGIALLAYVLIDLTIKNIDSEVNKKRQEEADLKQRKYIDEIQTNVFNGVLQKLISDDLFKILNRDVLNHNIIRENGAWDYIIKEENSGYSLGTTISYDCVNISQKIDAFPLRVVASNTSQNTSVIDSISIFENGKPVTIKPEIDKETEKQFSIKMLPEQRLKIVTKITNHYKSFTVIDCHFSNTSVLGLNINVIKPANCKFTAIKTFSADLNLVTDEPELLRYERIQGLLRGQCLIYYVEKAVTP